MSDTIENREVLYNLVERVNVFIVEMKSIRDDGFWTKLNEDLDQHEGEIGSNECDVEINISETFVSTICWLYSIDMV